MKLSELFESKDKLSIELDIGDELLVGKFKNRKATIKSFKSDDKGQPVAMTDKGEQKILKPRVPKLFPKELEEDISNTFTIKGKSYSKSEFMTLVTDIAKQVIHKDFRTYKNKSLSGLCGILTYDLWMALGKPLDFIPYSVMYGEDEHVLLYNRKLDIALDIAGTQFGEGKRLPFINTRSKEIYSNFYKLTPKEIIELPES